MSGTLQAGRRQALQPVVSITDLPGALAVLWHRRELLWKLTVRNVKSQYKQSILSYAWVIINPLLHALVLSFVFATFLRVSTPAVPFPLFVLVGLLPWMFFANSVAYGTDSVVNSASLVTKVYFPREILVMATVFARVVDLCFGLLVLIPFMAYFSQVPSWTIIWVPVFFAIHLVFTLGVALPLAALNLFFHDVRYLVGVALTLWFYVTPVFYPVDIVPPQYQFLFNLNPNSHVIQAYRRVLLEGAGPGSDRLLLGVAGAFVTFLVGYYLFKRLESGFADHI